MGCFLDHVIDFINSETPLVFASVNNLISKGFLRRLKQQIENSLTWAISFFLVFSVVNELGNIRWWIIQFLPD